MRTLRLVAIVMLSPACLFPPVGDLVGGDADIEESGTDATGTNASNEASTLDASTPIAFVQVVANEFDAGNTGIVSLSNVKAHHSIVICTGMDNSSALVAVSDSLGSTYTQVLAFPSTATGDPVASFVWAAFDVAGGNDTVTVTTSAAHTFFQVYMLEYAGLTGVDVHASAEGTQAGTDQMASGFATTTFGNELILGYGTDKSGVAGTGFSLQSGFESDVVEDRIVKTAGSYQATATMTSGNGWQISMVAFKGF